MWEVRNSKVFPLWIFYCRGALICRSEREVLKAPWHAYGHPPIASKQWQGFTYGKMENVTEDDSPIWSAKASKFAEAYY